MTKQCKDCYKTKPINEFYKHKQMGDGHINACKTCQKKAMKINKQRRKNIVYDKTLTKKCVRCGHDGIAIKDFYSKSGGKYNRDEWCKTCRKKHLKRYSAPLPEILPTHKICVNCNESKTLNEFNKEKAGKYGRRSECKSCRYTKHKQRILNNPEKYHKKNAARWKKTKVDPVKRVHKIISDSIGNALRRVGLNKSGRKSFEKFVNYTENDLMIHIESLFEPGMSWSNYGRTFEDKQCWHLDHIIPISTFSFTDINDPLIKTCWSLKNLQPLWESENLHKSNNPNYIRQIYLDLNIPPYTEEIIINSKTYGYSPTLLSIIR